MHQYLTIIDPICMRELHISSHKFTTKTLFNYGHETYITNVGTWIIVIRNLQKLEKQKVLCKMYESLRIICPMSTNVSWEGGIILISHLVMIVDV